MKTNTIEILAGNSAEDIEREILSEVSNNFCVAPEEFEHQYPGEKPVKYRVEVTVTQIDPKVVIIEPIAGVMPAFGSIPKSLEE